MSADGGVSGMEADGHGLTAKTADQKVGARLYALASDCGVMIITLIDGRSLTYIVRAIHLSQQGLML